MYYGSLALEKHASHESIGGWARGGSQYICTKYVMFDLDIHFQISRISIQNAIIHNLMTIWQISHHISLECIKTRGFPSQIMKSTKVLMATPQLEGSGLGYHTPEQA